MLAQKLLGATLSAPPKDPPVFVGAALVGYSSAFQNSISVPLNSLTGGIDTAAQAGDLVIFVGSILRNVSSTFDFVTSGYSSSAALRADGTSDTNLNVWFKVLSSAETSVSAALTSSGIVVAGVYVWRGVDSTTPFDATRTTATNTSSGTANSPSITTVTRNAVVISIGASSGNVSNENDFTVPSGMTNLAWGRSTNTGSAGAFSRAQLGFASIERPTAGAYDPPAFGGGYSTNTSTMAAVTMALRPA